MSTTQSTLLAQFGDGITAPVEGYAPANLQTATVLSTGELILSTIIGGLTIFAGIYFIFVFLFAALNWISAGDAKKAESARNSITQAVIGLIVIVSAYAVIGLIGSVVGIKILNPAAAINALIPK
jgi:hypothetical protein